MVIMANIVEQFVQKRFSDELNPGDSSMESSGIPGSPNTPVKKVMSKTHYARKYLVSLLCEMSLVGE